MMRNAKAPIKVLESDFTSNCENTKLQTDTLKEIQWVYIFMFVRAYIYLCVSVWDKMVYAFVCVCVLVCHRHRRWLWSEAYIPLKKGNINKKTPLNLQSLVHLFLPLEQTLLSLPSLSLSYFTLSISLSSSPSLQCWRSPHSLSHKRSRLYTSSPQPKTGGREKLTPFWKEC